MSFSISEIPSKGKGARSFDGYWPPLWAYLADIGGDILTDEDIEQGYSNNGHFISAEKAQQLYKRVKQQLDSGNLTPYHPEYGFPLDELHALVRFLRNSRGFTIY